MEKLNRGQGESIPSLNEESVVALNKAAKSLEKNYLLRPLN